MPQSETKRESRPKKKKNESLELLRAITKSMAGAVPGVSQETRDLIDDSLARPLSGMASQLAAEDPNEPGSLVFPPLHNLKRSWNADARRKAGKEPEKMAIPGLIQDTASLPAMFGGGPQWAQDAAASADRIHSGVDEGMNLAPPRGFRQHALNSAGMMGAQIPIAGKAKEIPQISKGALQLLKKYGMKALSSPLEFLSPTVDPKMSNYLLGSAAGGGLGALGDEASEIVEELPPPRAVARAKGGKIGGITEILRAISMNPDSTVRQTQHVIGDPVEEVLHAANEGQRKGVIDAREGQRIRGLIESGDEDALAESLMELQKKLFATPDSTPPVRREFVTRADVPSARGNLPEVKSEVPLLGPAPKITQVPEIPPKVRVGETPSGHGILEDRLLSTLNNLGIDLKEFDLIDEKGNLRVDEAREVIEDAMEGEREVDDLVEDLGEDEAEGITQAIQKRVRREPEQGEVPDSKWKKIRNRMKDWKVQSVSDLEDLLPTQTTETLRIPIPSMSKWTNWPDEPGTKKKKLDILKNPKSQKDVERWAGRDIREIRFMTDQDGDTYVWDADQAIHNQVLEALGLERKGLFHEMSDTPIPPKMFDQFFFINPWE